MNKAFIREPEKTAEYCPRCASPGDAVGGEVLRHYLTDTQRAALAEPANFCPSAKCPVAYFDGFEQFVLAQDLLRPAYPKDSTAPICACFGLTRGDVERDVEEGVKSRTKEIVERSKSAEARCSRLAANGRPCVAYIVKYFMELQAALQTE